MTAPEGSREEVAALRNLNAALREETERLREIIAMGADREPRMDGTLEQKLLWRIGALREALQAVTTIGWVDEAHCKVAKNALSVDDYNAAQCG
jgi:hypothetical protein